MEDWSNMVSTPEQDTANTGAPGWLDVAATALTGGLYGIYTGVDAMSGGALSSSASDYADAASDAVSSTVDAAKETVAEVGAQVADSARAAVSWLPWVAGGVVVLGLVAVALVFAPEVKGVAKLTGVT